MNAVDAVAKIGLVVLSVMGALGAVLALFVWVALMPTHPCTPLDHATPALEAALTLADAVAEPGCPTPADLVRRDYLSERRHVLRCRIDCLEMDPTGRIAVDARGDLRVKITCPRPHR